MKKTIALILGLVLCLSLVACGNNEELEKYKKYETLINYLEEEDYQKAYIELLKISRGGEDATIPTEEEKKVTTVEITPDNWQDYFEIRPFESVQYNDFGDLTYKSMGHALYLKEEYLPRVVNGGTDVSFKVGATKEYREYDTESKTFVEGGKVYTTKDTEFVTEVYDSRNSKDSDEYVSTANGQVCAEMICGDGIIDEVHYESIYTNFEIRDVTGTIELYE